ncbi:MAG: glutamine--fructose-6-phosphate transaminase (isomerizing) [Candidatus Shapirobacteria bacterium]|nr:glutamine--fructose-6-phosphate transaminase (isomerizing) [Candidatus Shapirobacteria bacterium]
MCGIVGFISSTEHDSNLVFNGLKNLEYRGYDSWGIVADTDQQLVDQKFLGKITSFPDQIPPSFISLGHTRWATHGGITLDNCHPHFDCHHQVALVHNGIVENYQSLQKDLKNHRILGQTDTEIIAHLIEKYRQKHNLLESVRLTFNQLHGLNAIAVMEHQNNQIIVAKNGSPLVIGLGKNANYLASDINAISNLTDQFIFLEDNWLAQITPQNVQIFDSATFKKIKYTIQKISSSLTDTDLNGYPNYLAKEIHQQFQIIKNINQQNLNQPINQILKLAQKSDQIFFTGCGSSYHAAYFNSLIVSPKINRPVYSFPASEFSPYDNFLTDKSLLVVFSQSGETIDAINLVNFAKNRGVTVASVINSPYSTLHRLADICQILPCGPEKCVLSTKTFTAQLALFLRSIGQDLTDSIFDIQQILKTRYLSKINLLAQKIASYQHIFIIARGNSLPIAHETALKIKEVSYIHAESFSGGELKHGPIALIEPGTPCIIIAPNDSHYDDIISSATEIKARGGWIIGISSKNNSVFDNYLSVSDSGLSTALSITVIAQILAGQLCQIKGYDPDKPRNLAKSVTVK